MISKSSGADELMPDSPGRPSPSALPVQTATTKSGVVPMAQASRYPKLVPVFHATSGALPKYCQPVSVSGLLTLLRAS